MLREIDLCAIMSVAGVILFFCWFSQLLDLPRAEDKRFKGEDEE